MSVASFPQVYLVKQGPTIRQMHTEGCFARKHVMLAGVGYENCISTKCGEYITTGLPHLRWLPTAGQIENICYRR